MSRFEDYKVNLRIKEILEEKKSKGDLIDGEKPTVSALAKAIKMAQPNLNNIVNGKSYTSLDTLERIAETLDVPFNQLFKNDGISGFIKLHGQVFEVNNIDDLKNIIEAYNLL